MKPMLGALAAIAALLLAALLPCLPGRHDVLAGTVSLVAQALAWTSLLLVPLGLVWFVHGLVWRAGDAAATATRRRYAAAAVAVCLPIGWFGALAAWASGSLSFAIPFALVWTTLAWRALRRAREREAAPGPDRATPLCCVHAPLAGVTLLWALGPVATEFARDCAIANAAPFLAEIERYRAERGRYPPSLQSLHGDYDPDVIGIDRYRYEPHGDAYNVFFEVPSYEIGARVIVMYNPRDEQTFSSHDSDFLRMSPAQVERARGFLEVRPAPQAHWRSFVFD